MAADPKYQNKVNFLLVNMSSLKDAKEFAKKTGLKGFAKHAAGQPPSAYGIMYIPHKVLIDGSGKVIRNFNFKLPGDLDVFLAGNAAPEAKDE